MRRGEVCYDALRVVMMRIYPALLLFLLIAAAGCGQTDKQQGASVDTIKYYKEIPGVTAEEIAAIEALKTKKEHFAYGTLLSTERFLLPGGTPAGFGVEFCNLLTELFGIPFVTEVHEWDELISKLESHSIDFTGELTPTEERINVKGYLMTYPIAERLLRLFTLADSEHIQSEKDLEGYTIAFLEDTVTAGDIRKIYRVSFKDVEVPDYLTAANMLQTGEINAFIDEAVADPAFDEYGFVQSQTIFPMVHSPVSMTTANSELAPIISVVNKYIAYTTAQENDVLYHLYKSGEFAYAKHKLAKLLTDEEKAYLKDLRDRGVSIRVASDQDSYPVNFYNTRAQELQGIAFDVLEEIGKLIDVKFKFIHGEDLVQAIILDRVKMGEIPMIMQLLKSESQKEHYIWASVPYARSHYAIISKSDFPNLESFQIVRHPVGILRDSAYMDVYRDLFPGGKGKVKVYNTRSECLDALERGDIDLLMASEYTLITQTHFREKAGFKINLRLPVLMDSYFGFHKDETKLCSIISKAQQFVPTDVIESRWRNRSFDYVRKAAEDRVLMMAIFSCVVTVLLAVSVLLRMRAVTLGKKLREIACKDDLTDIYNRRYFMEQAEIQIKRALRMNSQCFVVIYDLDHFKSVNDTHGHLAGDKVLREITKRVKTAIRPYDLFGRFGGEEFILLMSDISESDALNVLERLRQIVCGTPVEFEGTSLSISASFGIAQVYSGTDLDAATKHADKALYRAKKGGRNRVVLYG